MYYVSSFKNKILCNTKQIIWCKYYVTQLVTTIQHAIKKLEDLNFLNNIKQFK